ncbi:MAG TPA: tRNA (guanine-N1)-methyltransferase, partial [Nitrosopumilaceae archaeon]|nr:tRNA (guanine-N1)-methyltransferase [Nitrosopumilaceae archaeon]
LESEKPATYFTLDEIASKMKVSPLKLDNAISKLESSGFGASPTSLNPTGFRTNARIDEVLEIFTC